MIIPQNHLWPWQEPGSPLYSIRGAYELAYVDPARAATTPPHGRADGVCVICQGDD